MNAKLLAAVETLAAKAIESGMGHEAKSYAEAAMALAQAVSTLHYVEQTPCGVGVGIAQQPAGGTD